jgi:Ca2+-binding RTX toxin-like protein
MVKATFTSLLDFDTVDTYYTDDSLELRTERSQKAVYVDTESGNRIVFEGTNFSYDGDVLVGGTITDVQFKANGGGDYATITGADYDAEKLASILTDRGVQPMLRNAFRGDDLLIGSSARDVFWAAAGDDTLRGRAGGDTLEGGKGDDRLVGGRGSDLFIFDPGDGRDTITDFDANGGGNLQDYIGVDSTDDLSIRRSGSDTVVDFGDGDTITLVGVARSDVSHSDFHEL